MCTSCVSTAEAVILNGAGVVAVARGTVHRIGDALAGRPPEQRRRAAWEANASFLAGLDLDPEASLGPRPSVPAPAVTVAVDGRVDGLGVRFA